MKKLKNKKAQRFCDERGDVVVMPAGEYVLGDPCYSFHGERDKQWTDWLNIADFKNASVLVGSIDGYTILGLGTMYGDGAYSTTLSSGFVVGVDAGLVGLVPVEFNGVADGLVEKVVFDNPVECWREDNGDLHFGEIVVHTGDDAYEEEENYVDYDNDDEEDNDEDVYMS